MRPTAVYGTYRGGAALIGALPRRMVDPLAASAARYAARHSERARAVVAGNLRHVLGPAVSPAELDRAVEAAFSSYARYWVEAARLRRPADARDLPFELVGREYLDEGLAGGAGLLLVLPHIGTWELAGAWLADRGTPVTTVAEVLEPPSLFEWFCARREATGIRVLPLGSGTTPTLLSTLRAGGIVALLGDRDIPGGGLEVEFFGEKTTLPVGPAVLALRSRAALSCCAIYQQPNHGVRIELRPPIPTDRQGSWREDLERITMAIRDDLEKLIAAAPEQWHVFQPNWPSGRGEPTPG